MEIGVIGTSIWQQNMSLLEKLTIDRDKREALIGELKSKIQIDEIIYMATCNRVEFIYATNGKYRGPRVLHRLIDFFFCRNKEINFFPNDFFHYTGKEAITHLFRTASSLESLVMGENQIAGQFKEAHKEAMEIGIAGNILDRLAKESLNVAKKVKGQTALSDGALSMASLASRELKSSLENIDNPKIAIIGSGPMQVKLARYINDKLNGTLLFVSRTAEKAQKFADEYNGQATTLESFRGTPGTIDAIVSSTAAVEPVFDACFLGKLSGNQNRVVCIDLAIPRDFSIDFFGDERVRLIDIPYLKSKGQGNLRQKFVEAGKANDIIREAVGKFMIDEVEISLRPIFRDCHRESMEIAEKGFDDLLQNSLANLDENERSAVKRLLGRVVGHTAYSPLKKISNNLIEKGAELNLDSSNRSGKKAQ